MDTFQIQQYISRAENLKVLLKQSKQRKPEKLLGDFTSSSSSSISIATGLGCIVQLYIYSYLITITISRHICVYAN